MAEGIRSALPRWQCSDDDRPLIQPSPHPLARPPPTATRRLRPSSRAIRWPRVTRSCALYTYLYTVEMWVFRRTLFYSPPRAWPPRPAGRSPACPPRSLCLTGQQKTFHHPLAPQPRHQVSRYSLCNVGLALVNAAATRG